jgi:imidazolonepropionase-like amidohydrolase
MKTKFLAISFFVLSNSVTAQTVAIRAGNVIDTSKGTVAKDQIILIEDGKIKSISAGTSAPAGAQLIDLSNEWITPGLMDAHTHVTLTEVPGKAPFEAAYLQQSSAFRALHGLRYAQDILRAGFTTLREVGNEANYACADVRKAIKQGWFDGPTFQCAGKIIAPFGGQSGGYSPEQGPFWRWEYLDADTPEEIRKAIHENIYYGADVIKLAADNSAYFYSESDIRAAVQEAHAAGRPVAVHVYGGPAADAVIRGGADSVEHGFALTDEQLKLMKEKGTFLVGTDFPEAHLAMLSPSNDILKDSHQLAADIIDRLRRANKIGVKIAFGSDTVTDMPNRTRADMMLDYLAVFRAAGVTPAQMLRYLTSGPAELLRIEKQRGAVVAGLAADIIAMPANPLDDTEALRNVNFVMKDGKIIRSPK